MKTIQQLKDRVTMKLIFFEKNELGWAAGILEINARSLLGWQYHVDYGHSLELFFLVFFAQNSITNSRGNPAQFFTT